jgi:serine protease Do
MTESSKGPRRIRWFNPFFTLTLIILVSCNAQNKKSDLTPKVSIEELQNKEQEGKNSFDGKRPSDYKSLIDFRYAAKKVTPCVVHIQVTYKPEKSMKSPLNDEEFYHGFPDPFKDLFKDDPLFHHYEFQFPDATPQPMAASGSGIIITNDGYILTNNHVISEADSISIVLSDRRSYHGKVVGTDPQTDLALLKIPERNLQFLRFGNSDSVEVGEWVLAVGNPFNLASTVTAGIVSAKARNINILKEQGSIESFIQTDAAVNPGNSGGALVNLNGDLVGINTAIATPTGVYAGYAFAVPSNIAKKIVDDLLNYGVVERGYLGVVIRNLDENIANKMHLDVTKGVYVDSLVEDGAAKSAGIMPKDVILRIDDKEVNTTPELQEYIAKKRPGDQVTVSILRNGKEKQITVKLKSREGKLELVKKEKYEALKVLGIEVVELSIAEKKKAMLPSGVKVEKIYPGGKIKSFTNMHEHFIIMKVNNTPVSSIEEFIKQIDLAKNNGVLLEGRYLGDRTVYYYAFGMR